MILESFLWNINNFQEDMSDHTPFGFDPFNHVCRWPRALNLELLDGIMTHVCVSGVYDEINPEKGRQTEFNKHIWDWWDDNVTDISPNSNAYPDMDLILYNLKGVRDIEYGIHPKSVELKDSCVLAIISNGMVLGWDQTLLICTMLGLATVPALSTSRVCGSRGDYFTELNELLKIPSILGSIDIRTFKPRSKKGVLVRNYDSFPISDIVSSCFKMEYGFENPTFVYNTKHFS